LPRRSLPSRRSPRWERGPPRAIQSRRHLSRGCASAGRTSSVVPGKPERSDRLIEAALEALRGALTDASVPWMIIGGIAVIARGVRRFTTDIDAAVRGDAITVERLVRCLETHDIRPRIADAVPFARANLVLLMRHGPTGVDLDISLAWSEFELYALSAAQPTAFGRTSVPMSTPSDLVVFKAIAGRPRDVEDLEALLVLYPSIDVRGVRQRVVELAALADAPEIVGAFDEALRRVGRSPITASKPPRRRKK